MRVLFTGDEGWKFMLAVKNMTRVSFVAALCMIAGQGAWAQDRKALQQTAAAPPAVYRDVAESQALQVYDATMVNCLTEITGIDPVEIARTGDKKALNMDRAKLMKIDECVTKQGFSSSFGNESTLGMDAENPNSPGNKRVTELLAVQQALDATAPNSVTGAAQATPRMIPKQVIAPEQPLVAPVVTPPPVVKAEEKPEPEAVEPRAPRPQNQFWVKPQK